MRKLFLLLALATAASAAAQSRDAVIDQTIAALQRVQKFEQVAIAPDGSRVAYVKTVRGPDGQRTNESGIYAGATHITAGAPNGRLPEESDFAWSPDSRRIAFVSDAGGEPQLYVASSDGTGVRAVTKIHGALAMPKWSPEGKAIAVLMIENASRKGGALEAMTPPSGDVDTQVEEQRLAIVDPATQTLQFATPPDMYVYDYDWSPDSRSIAAEATFGSGEDNYWTAQLFRFDRGEMKGRSIYKPALQIANPSWSPDGKSIAFIEGLMSDQGVTGGDVFVVPATGGEATNVTPGLQA
ncbi:MAG TPA: hypothetical protein VF980_11630, partial [Thermoanaerobaculia bacterium]